MKGKQKDSWVNVLYHRYESALLLFLGGNSVPLHNL